MPTRRPHVERLSSEALCLTMLEYEVIWGHIDILVVAVRRLSRRWKLKTRLAGPSPTSPMKAEITISPISNRQLQTVLGPTIVKIYNLEYDVSSAVSDKGYGVISILATLLLKRELCSDPSRSHDALSKRTILQTTLVHLLTLS